MKTGDTTGRTTRYGNEVRMANTGLPPTPLEQRTAKAAQGALLGSTPKANNKKPALEETGWFTSPEEREAALAPPQHCTTLTRYDGIGFSRYNPRTGLSAPLLPSAENNMRQATRPVNCPKTNGSRAAQDTSVKAPKRNIMILFALVAVLAATLICTRHSTSSCLKILGGSVAVGAIAVITRKCMAKKQEAELASSAAALTAPQQKRPAAALARPQQQQQRSVAALTPPPTLTEDEATKAAKIRNVISTVKNLQSISLQESDKRTLEAIGEHISNLTPNPQIDQHLQTLSTEGSYSLKTIINDIREVNKIIKELPPESKNNFLEDAGFLTEIEGREEEALENMRANTKDTKAAAVAAAAVAAAAAAGQPPKTKAAAVAAAAAAGQPPKAKARTQNVQWAVD